MKPDESILFRPVWYGGLGLAPIKHKSVAYLIRTFLELAANPNYHHSPFLSSLYRVHILGEDSPCPVSPPYYSDQFYNYILGAKNSGRNIITMTTKQWYHYIIDQELLKASNDDGILVFRLCRAERLSPDMDWKSVWDKVRHPSLSSSTASFLWKLLHDLLTTEERLANTLGNTPPSCRFGCEGQEATLEHCFFKCNLTNDVGSWLLVSVQRSCSSADEKKVLSLNFSSSDSILWNTANTPQFLWNNRALKKKATLYSCLAYLRMEALKLSDTTHEQLVPSILEIIDPEEHQV